MVVGMGPTVEGGGGGVGAAEGGEGAAAALGDSGALAAPAKGTQRKSEGSCYKVVSACFKQ